MATKHQSESIDKAMALLLVHYENVVVLCSRYDPTAHATQFCEATEGNEFSLRGHVDDFADRMRDGGSMGCGPDCECRTDEDDETDENEDGDDGLGNR